MKEYNLTIADLQNKFNASESTIRKSVRKWIETGLPYRDIGLGKIPRYRFNEKDIEEFMTGNKE